jgi:hypothetical protein
MIGAHASTHVGAHVAPTVDAITSALRQEEHLLRELAAVLRGQRSAIAEDDLERLDDAVFGTHRVLLTLGEARRRRQTLNTMLGEAEDLSMQALRDAFGGTPPTAVQAAMDALVEAGEQLHREVDLNQRVLRIAIDSGDQLVRALCGAPSANTYGGDGTPPLITSLLDRRI